MSINTRYHPGLAAGCPTALTASNKASANNEASRLRLNRSLSGAARGPVTSFPSAPPRSNRRLSEAYGKGLSPCHRVLSSRFVVLLLGYKIQDFRRFVNRIFCDISVIFAKSAATGGIQALFRWKFPGFFSPFPGQIIRNRDFGIALDKFPPNLYNSDVEAI